MRGRNNLYFAICQFWAETEPKLVHRGKNRISEKTFLARSISTYPVSTVHAEIVVQGLEGLKQ
jgi:hypothetical protein